MPSQTRKVRRAIERQELSVNRLISQSVIHIRPSQFITFPSQFINILPPSSFINLPSPFIHDSSFKRILNCYSQPIPSILAPCPPSLIVHLPTSKSPFTCHQSSPFFDGNILFKQISSWQSDCGPVAGKGFELRSLYTDLAALELCCHEGQSS